MEGTNLYLNPGLIGGSPPTGHSVGFGTNSYTMDFISLGFREQHANAAQSSGRCYMTYDRATNNPALEVGAQYRLSYEVEQITTSTTAVMSLPNPVNITVDAFDYSAIPTGTKTVFAEFTVNSVGYDVTVRIGQGITSNTSHQMKVRYPQLVKIADAP